MLLRLHNNSTLKFNKDFKKIFFETLPFKNQFWSTFCFLNPQFTTHSVICLTEEANNEEKNMWKCS